LREKTLKGLKKFIVITKPWLYGENLQEKSYKIYLVFVLTCRSIAFSSGFLLFTVCIPAHILKKGLKI